VIPVSQNNQELIKQLEKLEYLKKKRDGRYELTGKMLKTLLEQLEKQLETNQITPEEYNRQKTLLQSRLKKSTSPGYKMSAKELARTIMEMIDARDKQWNEGVNFQTMRTYYHIKENNAGERLSEEKRDYYGLQKLIEDLEKRQILTSVSSTDGLMLSGLALDMLLGYLMKSDRSLQGLLGLRGTGRAKVYERSQFVRRYSTGDTFKNIAIRRTLREAVRQRRGLSEIRRSDLRVFLRQQREPVSDIVICLDISGSMGFHQKLLYARIIASRLVQAAAVQGNRVGLVAFSDSGRTTVPLAENNKERLLGVIAGLSARGNTNVGEGIKAARKMLTAAPNDNQKQVILISDGQATAISESAFDKIKGRQEKDLTEESAIEETRLSAALGIKLSVIHIAGEGRNNEDFIRNIARAGKGQIKRIRGARDFQMIIK
jgi:Mg-chelatase subunit ChlD